MSHIENGAESSHLNASAESVYCIAAHYRNEHAAGRAYVRAQDTLLKAEGCDLSSYRLQLDRVWHVAVLGDRPAPELDRRLRLILASGTAVTLADEIIAVLMARRAQATQLGPWVERHHRPGQQL